MAAAGFRGIAETLRHRAFARYVLGNVVSLIGTWMQRIAVGWLTWELTGSPTWLGIIAMTELFPAVFLGPLGGVLADRVDRVKVMLVTQSCAMFVAIGLFAITVAGMMTIWVLASMTLVTGLIIGLHHPARLALAPSLVPADNLATAIAVNSMVFNGARFIGPALAGVLVAHWDIEVAFAVNAVSYLPLLVVLATLNVESGAVREAVPSSVIAGIADAVRFIVGHPATGPMLLVLAASSLCVRPIVELLPGLADTVYGRGSGGFAALVAAIGAGAVAGGLWMASRGGRAEAARQALIGAAVSIGANLGLIATDDFHLALVGAVVAGAGMVMTGIGIQTTFQFSVGSRMRGRVLSLYGVVVIGGPAAGALVIGAMAEGLGLRPSLAAAVVVAALVWAWAWSRRGAVAEALRRSGTADQG